MVRQIQTASCTDAARARQDRRARPGRSWRAGSMGRVAAGRQRQPIRGRAEGLARRRRRTRGGHGGARPQAALLGCQGGWIALPRADHHEPDPALRSSNNSQVMLSYRSVRPLPADAGRRAPEGRPCVQRRRQQPPADDGVELTEAGRPRACLRAASGVSGRKCIRLLLPTAEKWVSARRVGRGL